MSKERSGQLSNPTYAVAVVACLVNRLDGNVVLTQKDFDAIAYCSLIEEGNSDGSYSLTIKRKTSQ